MTAAVRLDEAEILRRLQARSADREAAFAELYAGYRLRVFALCRHLVNSRADAEDATQEVFLALHRALPGFRGEAALGTFIHRIAIRVALRQRGRRRPDADLPADAAAPAAHDPAELREDQERLWRAVGQLSPEHRTVLGLFAIDGLGHREIAAILGVPEGTVWSRLHLARKRLAALVERG
jgi:RNA polymerase sigma-70 factor (ECF subfamily)